MAFLFSGMSFLAVSSAVRTADAAQPDRHRMTKGATHTGKVSDRPAGNRPAAAMPQSVETLHVMSRHHAPSPQRRGEAVQIVSGEQLSTLNIVRPEELSRLAPGFTAIQDNGTDVSAFSLRGVGAGDQGEQEEQAVATYMDGVYVASPGSNGFPFFDINNVEILRGPQSTSGGRSADAGSVSVSSNKPTAGTSAAIEGSYGSYNLHRFQGFVNEGNDKIAGRLAFYYSKRAGYQQNALGPDLYAEEVGALRGQVRFWLSDRDTFTLRLEGWESGGNIGYRHTATYYDSQGVTRVLPPNVNAWNTCAGCDAYGMSSTRPFAGAVNDPGAINKRVGTIAGTYNHTFGHHINLTAIASFGTTNTYYREDTDGTPDVIAQWGQSSNTNVATTEVKLHRDIGRDRWTVGGYFVNIDGSYKLDYFYNEPGILDSVGNTPTDSQAYLNYSLRTRGFSAYAQNEFDILPNLTLLTGIRYDRNDEKYSVHYACKEQVAGLCDSYFGTGGPTAFANSPYAHLTQGNNNWDGRIQINYHVIPNFMLYGSVTRGTKAPGFTAVLSGAATAATVPFAAESIAAYEGGFKSSFFEHRLTLNADWFYYDFHNYQANLFNGIVNTVISRPATDRGAEVEASYRPVKSLFFSAGLAHAVFLIKDIATVAAPLGQSQYGINAPKWQVNFSANKEFKLSDTYRLRFTYNLRYTSGRYFNLTNTPILYAPAYVMHDATLRLDSKAGWYVAVFGNNLTNAAYATAKFDLGSGMATAHYGMARMVGGTIGYTY
ncbi:hypothetical protein BGC31_07225 [Komagataeibacter xylinus]|nr:hypothetical protein BGC31_07225 [Komagataeibacter xylinus]RFP04009.1 hypothetical protein BFX83_09330 [Komagataeibacter xylinus]